MLTHNKFRLEIDRNVQVGGLGLSESWPTFRQIYTYVNCQQVMGTFLQKSISHTHHTEKYVVLACTQHNNEQFITKKQHNFTLNARTTFLPI